MYKLLDKIVYASLGAFAITVCLCAIAFILIGTILGIKSMLGL